MPRPLTDERIEAFRSDLCEVATRCFAEQGYAGVTMRGLALELGCSPMTPYRYFRNKEEIFAAVRAAAFARFADRLEAAETAARGLPPLDVLRSLSRVYVSFALDEPHAYRIMFELDQPPGEGYPALSREEERGWKPLHDAMEAAIRVGLLDGDADTLAHVFWAGFHGLMTLHLAGKLRLGRTLEDLLDLMLDTLLKGLSSRGGAHGV